MDGIRYALAAGCILLILLPVLLLAGSKLVDRMAVAAGRRHLAKLGYEHVRSSQTKKHYAVYFKIHGQTVTSRFHYFPGRGIRWLEQPPEEQVARLRKS